MLASLVMTTVYHLGYRDFRSALLARPVAADRLADLAAQPGLAPLADVLQLNDGGLQLDPNQWRRTWFKGGVGSGVFASAYLATTQTGRSYVVAAVAQNPTPPLPEGQISACWPPSAAHSPSPPRAEHLPTGIGVGVTDSSHVFAFHRAVSPTRVRPHNPAGSRRAGSSPPCSKRNGG